MKTQKQNGEHIKVKTSAAAETFLSGIIPDGEGDMPPQESSLKVNLYLIFSCHVTVHPPNQGMCCLEHKS